jgi:hypothetical protein
MALKDLLVCVDQTEDAMFRLRLAADLAIRHGSRLTALFAREWTRAQLDHRKAAELGLVSSERMRDRRSIHLRSFATDLNGRIGARPLRA